MLKALLPGCYVLWADWGRTSRSSNFTSCLRFSSFPSEIHHCYAFASSLMEQRTVLISGYIGEFEVIDDHRGGKVVIQLNGRLNKCGVISPRFNVPVDGSELSFLLACFNL